VPRVGQPDPVGPGPVQQPAVRADHPRRRWRIELDRLVQLRVRDQPLYLAQRSRRPDRADQLGHRRRDTAYSGPRSAGGRVPWAAVVILAAGHRTGHGGTERTFPLTAARGRPVSGFAPVAGGCGPGVRGGRPGVRGGRPGVRGGRPGGPGVRGGGPDRASSSRSPIWISRVRIPAIASWNCVRMSRCRAASPSGAGSGSFGPAPPSGCGVSPRAIIRRYRLLPAPCIPYAQKNVVALRNCEAGPRTV